MSLADDIETITPTKTTKIAVEIKKLDNYGDLPLPQYATSSSAGLDLMSVSTEDITLRSGQSVLVATGLAIALPVGFEAQVRPRSGLAAKHQITVLNSPGTIDADYRGEIKVILINHGPDDFVISRGMRIAQMVIASVWQPTLVEVSELGMTERGEGGFGSTGL